MTKAKKKLQGFKSPRMESSPARTTVTTTTTTVTTTTRVRDFQ